MARRGRDGGEGPDLDPVGERLVDRGVGGPDPEGDPAESDDVLGDRDLVGDLGAVERGAVGAGQVTEVEPGRRRLEFGVAPGYRGVGDDQLALGGAAEGDLPARFQL
jgi:hypothetical protein